MASVTVLAISLRDESVAAAVQASGGYSVRVPAGPYLLFVVVIEPGRRSVVATRAVLARGHVAPISFVIHAGLRPSVVAPAAAIAAKPAALAVDEIPITFPDGQKIKAGGEDPMITGLFPVCERNGAKLIEISKAARDAVRREQQLSDEGRLAFKILVHPITPDAIIQGEVSVGPNGGPRSDLRVVDQSGKVLKHYIISGDPADWDQISNWGKRIGSEIGRDLLSNPPPFTPDPCAPASTPPPPGTFSAEYKGSASDTSMNTYNNGGFVKGVSSLSWDIRITTNDSGQITSHTFVAQGTQGTSDQSGTTITCNIKGSPAASGLLGISPGLSPGTVNVTGGIPDEFYSQIHYTNYPPYSGSGPLMKCQDASPGEAVSPLFDGWRNDGSGGDICAPFATNPAFVHVFALDSVPAGGYSKSWKGTQSFSGPQTCPGQTATATRTIDATLTLK